MASAAPNLRITRARIRPDYVSVFMWVGLAAAGMGCVPRNDLDSYGTEAVSGLPGDATAAEVDARIGRDDAGEPDAVPVTPEMPSVSVTPTGEGTPLDVAVRLMAPKEVAGGPASSDSGPADADDVVEAGPRPAAVVTWAPVDGALGVAASVVVVLDFGRRMDTATVPAALQADGVLLDATSFVWSDADSVLSIRSPQPLATASGEDPSLVEPLCYTYRIGPDALDAEGQPIEASQIRFCTERHISQRFSALPDRLLTGNFRSDGNYGDGTCGQTTGFDLCVGDSGYATNTEYRGFISFDAPLLQAPGTTIERGEVRLDIPGVRGNPFATLGALLVERVHFVTIGAEAFADAEALALGSFAELPGSSIWSADVSAGLREPEPGLTQFRLRFAVGTDLNGIADHILGRTQPLELLVDYRIP